MKRLINSPSYMVVQHSFVAVQHPRVEFPPHLHF